MVPCFFFPFLNNGWLLFFPPFVSFLSCFPFSFAFPSASLLLGCFLFPSSFAYHLSEAYIFYTLCPISSFSPFPFFFLFVATTYIHLVLSLLSSSFPSSSRASLFFFWRTCRVRVQYTTSDSEQLPKMTGKEGKKKRSATMLSEPDRMKARSEKSSWQTKPRRTLSR